MYIQGASHTNALIALWGAANTAEKTETLLTSNSYFINKHGITERAEERRGAACPQLESPRRCQSNHKPAGIQGHKLYNPKPRDQRVQMQLDITVKLLRASLAAGREITSFLQSVYKIASSPFTLSDMTEHCGLRQPPWITHARTRTRKHAHTSTHTHTHT